MSSSKKSWLSEHRTGVTSTTVAELIRCFLSTVQVFLSESSVLEKCDKYGII